KEKLEHAILMRPIAKDATDAITINLTETGLQVLLVDSEGRAMFAPGAAEPTAEAEALLEETARALKPLANRLFIEAHADASGAGAYSPFDLTAARANAARRVMEAAGFPANRIAGVTAKGDAFPLYPENPFAAGNRRIEITLEPAASLLPDERPL
ncbi:MAG: flagellar motor protein MotB, partial [Parvularculaceae bacterium]